MKPPVSDLESHIGYWLRFVSNHVSHAFMQKVEGEGVTVAEWAVMREMFQAESFSPSRLAEQLGDGCGGNEEREQRQQGEVGKVAGVDEPVVVDSDQDPLGDFPCISRLVDLVGNRLPVGRGFGR